MTERQQIVEWLRGQAAEWRDAGDMHCVYACIDAAKAIERGHHLPTPAKPTEWR